MPLSTGDPLVIDCLRFELGLSPVLLGTSLPALPLVLSLSLSLTGVSGASVTVPARARVLTAAKKPFGTGAGPVCAAVSGAVGFLSLAAFCCRSVEKLLTGLRGGGGASIGADVVVDDEDVAVGGRFERRRMPGVGIPDIAGNDEDEDDVAPEPETWCRVLEVGLSADPGALLRDGADGLRWCVSLVGDGDVATEAAEEGAIEAGGRSEPEDLERGRRETNETCGMAEGCIAG